MRNFAIALNSMLVSLGCTKAETVAPLSYLKLSSCGYEIVFADDFKSRGTIDWEDTRKPGFNWYRGQFFGAPSTLSQFISVESGQLVLTGASRSNNAIETAVPATNERGWIGRAFRGGYFEARIALGPEMSKADGSWPAFWGMPIEHMAGRLEDKWKEAGGGFEHFVENDFFEADTAYAGPETYGVTLHDWWGVFRKTCPSTQYCHKASNSLLGHNTVVRLPGGEGLSEFHTYGQLWVPSGDGREGYIQNYLDGAPVLQRFSWVSTDHSKSPPPLGDQLFSALDQEHLVLILGTSTHREMRVQWVRVWQQRTSTGCNGVVEP